MSEANAVAQEGAAARSTIVPLRPAVERDSNGRPRLVFETLGQLLDRHIPTREYLVEPWLREGESALVYADAGVGKSMLVMALALAVAGTGTFLDWTSAKPWRVLYIDGEMSDADMQERGGDLLSSVEGINANAVRDNLVFLARQRQDPEAPFPDLDTDAGQRQVLNMVREKPTSKRAGKRKIDLLILDNLSTLFTIEDENAAASFNKVVAFLMRIKQAGVACILVHHTNKGGISFRGSSKLATTFEAIIALRKGDSSDEEGPTFEMEWDKFRGKRRDAVTVSRKVMLRPRFEEGLMWLTEGSPRVEVQALVTAVRSGKFSNQNELAEHFGKDKGTISRWKWQAIDDFKVITRDEWDDCLDQADGDDATESDF